MKNIKQLLDEVFVICKIINVEVRVIGELITLTETLIILHITKTESNKIVLLYISSEKKTNTNSNNCFIVDFKPKIINVARRTIKNKLLPNK